MKAIPSVLLVVWEQFMQKKWKAVMKVIIMCMKLNEEALLSMRFDQILIGIPEMMKALIIQDNASGFIEEFQKIKISKSTINEITEEYSSLAKNKDEIIALVEVKSPRKKHVSRQVGVSTYNN